MACCCVHVCFEPSKSDFLLKNWTDRKKSSIFWQLPYWVRINSRDFQGDLFRFSEVAFKFNMMMITIIRIRTRKKIHPRQGPCFHGWQYHKWIVSLKMFPFEQKKSISLAENIVDIFTVADGSTKRRNRLRSFQKMERSFPPLRTDYYCFCCFQPLGSCPSASDVTGIPPTTDSPRAKQAQSSYTFLSVERVYHNVTRSSSFDSFFFSGWEKGDLRGDFSDRSSFSASSFDTISLL